MMLPNEINIMELYAREVLATADNEDWSKTDGTRLLADLAIKAAGELKEQRASVFDTVKLARNLMNLIELAGDYETMRLITWGTVLKALEDAKIK